MGREPTREGGRVINLLGKEEEEVFEVIKRGKQTLDGRRRVRVGYSGSVIMT